MLFIHFQVALPALHISLGSYLKFFNLLEDSCHMLDVKLAGEMAMKDQSINRIQFNEYITSQHRIRDLENIINNYNEKINLIYNAVSINILKNPEKAEEIKNVYHQRLTYLEQKKHDKVSFKS